jgi:hypothetical protein
MLNPSTKNLPLAANLQTAAFYLREAEAYLEGLFDLLPESLKKPYRLDPEVAARDDILALMKISFAPGDRRRAFEAQRKLYLAKLIFDIDRCRDVQDGLEHKSYLEKLLEKGLWSRIQSTEAIEIWYNISTDGISMEYSRDRARPDQECWRFEARAVTPLSGSREDPMKIYYNRTRFKKEVLPFEYAAGRDEYTIEEPRKWYQLKGRRNGGILSKMIRKGENDPRKIGDILGSMFIVEDKKQVHLLLQLLQDILGAPYSWHDVVDTIHRPQDRTLLDRHSGAGYEVYKSDVDVLYPTDWKHTLPYAFRVEIQVYTLEGFLRTVHSSHYASHRELKRRQFLDGLLPYIFPSKIYGNQEARKTPEAG